MSHYEQEIADPFGVNVTWQQYKRMA